MAEPKRRAQPADDVYDRLMEKAAGLPPKTPSRPRALPDTEGRQQVVEQRASLRQPEPVIDLPDRPAVFTAASEELFFNAVRVGNRLQAACRFAGLSHKHVRDWLERGSLEATGFYASFHRKYEMALGTAEVTQQANIAKAAKDPKQWRAAAYLLRNRFPGGWGRDGGGGSRVRVIVPRGAPPAADASVPALPPGSDPMAHVPLGDLVQFGLELEAHPQDDD